jgi:RecA/RadA recombinase
MSKNTDNICPARLGEEVIIAPKEVMDKDKMKALDTALAKINKKFGNGTVTKASDAEEKLIKRTIKTPSIEFNNMLGGGMKSFIELYGPPSSGRLEFYN